MKKTLLTAAAFLIALGSSFTATAQQKAPDNWFNLDLSKDNVYGVSTERAYTELLKGKTGKTVVVAVIDGGTDILHEDLQSVLWSNPGEIPGNNIDDDKNGYVDDIHGWSFISGKDGEVKEDNLELTRLYRMYSQKFEKLDKAPAEEPLKSEFATWKKVKAAYEKEKEVATKNRDFYGSIINGIRTVAGKIGHYPITAADVKAFKPETEDEKVGHNFLTQFTRNIPSLGEATINKFIGNVQGAYDHFDKQLKYNLNTEFDPRSVVGDNYANDTERFYGDNRVKGPESYHGTHVAGIIAADRTNNIGMKGVCATAQIMVLRVVPDGDERDKDVANAIRYAADNGASVINMSFGKAWSYNKKIVDEAVQYALSKNVVLVHAAGNDGKNTDVEPNFPSDNYVISTTAPDAWIEVGASSWSTDKYLPADFSNYAKKNVDLFAPGVDIYSCAPDSQLYGVSSGTSMAGPVTAGVAALVRSYYPTLTNVQVKQILMESVVPIEHKVIKPGTTKKKTKMKSLSVSGGIVNAYNALQLAEKMVNGNK